MNGTQIAAQGKKTPLMSSSLEGARENGTLCLLKYVPWRHFLLSFKITYEEANSKKFIFMLSHVTNDFNCSKFVPNPDKTTKEKNLQSPQVCHEKVVISFSSICLVYLWVKLCIRISSHKGHVAETCHSTILDTFSDNILPSCPNPDPISDQNIKFSPAHFQTWPLKSLPIFTPNWLKNYNPCTDIPL